MKPAVLLIAAMSENRVIGVNGKLPWRLPDDLMRFKALTLGHAVIMGRKTYESIGRPLPDRLNIVISRKNGLRIPGCVVAPSPERAMDMASSWLPLHQDVGEPRMVAVIGGGQIYDIFLPIADCIALTVVHTALDGDAFFPEFNEDAFTEVGRNARPSDDRHPFAFTFRNLERK